MNTQSSKRAKPATLTVYGDEKPPITHELVSDKDWSVIFEDVLEVKAEDGAHYYPLSGIARWIVR